jgi:hypothetical protein
MVYWQYSTGKWIYYSYPDGVMFDFLQPYLVEFLFSFRKGWFIYTPILLLSFAGLVWMWKKQRSLFFPLLVYSALFIYVASSWSCWWYAGGDFSQRAMVSTYAFLSIPLGYFMQWSVSGWKKALFLPMIAGLIVLNLFQTRQFYHGVLDGERMTGAYYGKIFGKMKASEEDRALLSVNRADFRFLGNFDLQGYRCRTVHYDNFRVPLPEKRKQYISNATYFGKVSYQLDSLERFLPALQKTFQELTREEVIIIEASVDLYMPAGFKGDTPLLLANFEHRNKSYAYIDVGFRMDTVHWNSWNRLRLRFISPEILRPNDKVTITVWHRANTTIYADKFKVVVYERQDQDH